MLGLGDTILYGMRSLALTVVLSLGINATGRAQIAPPSFEVASVRPSQREVGPDYNNRITYSPGEFTGHNVTLKRLIAESWHCELKQEIGPPWLDRNEYEVEARLPDGASDKQIPAMLGLLLQDRFALKAHRETRPMRVYELTAGKNGPKIHADQAVSAHAPATTPGAGMHFQGDMREFADFLAVQFSIPAPENPNTPVKAGGPSIPVLDKTGLEGTYNFSVDIHPEQGTDAFTSWKRALEEQLGLKVETRMAAVPVVVVDDAAKIPTEN